MPPRRHAVAARLARQPPPRPGPHGQVATAEISPEPASRLHATIRAAIAKPDGFGEAYDLKKQGLGYFSPAGSIVVKPPAKKGGAWHVSYTA